MAWMATIITVVITSFASIGYGDTILVDFGNNSSFRGVSVSSPDENGRYWNSVWSGAFYANMVNAANEATAVDFGFDTATGTDSFNGPAGATSIPPTSGEIANTAFNAIALEELGATNAVFDFYINSNFQLQGLEPSLTYTLTFFGSHKFSTDSATKYALYTDNSYATEVASVNLNVQNPGNTSLHNQDSVAVLSNVSPQPDGKFYVKFRGASGNNGYLNAMMIEWQKASTLISSVPASQSVSYGTANVTLSGTVSAPGPLYPAAGETVSVIVNGITQNTTITGGAGAFSLSYPVSAITAGVHTITYTYSGNTLLMGTTNNATSLTVTKLAPFLAVKASQSAVMGTSSVTLTGLVSAAGPVYPANGSTVSVTINGVAQTANISGGAGAFAINYVVSSLSVGDYPITYTYAGNASTLDGITNAATMLTISPDYQIVLLDFGNSSSFRGVSVASPDENGRYWNSVWAGAFYTDLVNKSNVATPLDLGFDTGAADSYNGPAGATTQPPTPSEIAATAFNAVALGDLGVTNAVFDFYVNGRFQLQGLETGLTYRLTLFGSHKFSADDTTVYALCTDNTYATTTTTVSLNVQMPGSPSLHNSNTVALIATATPRPDGKLYVAYRGANGNNGYLNAMKLEWEKAPAVISGISAGQSVSYGTSSVTMTGIVGAVNVPAKAGDVVGVTINGVISNATVSGVAGGFAVTLPVSSLAAGTHTITYTYAGSAVLLGATNATTQLTVTKLTPTIGVNASPSVGVGVSSVTLTGLVSAAGGTVVPANGSTVAVTIQGVTQHATIAGGAGGFSLNYTMLSLTVGTYAITYTYAGNAT